MKVHGTRKQIAAEFLRMIQEGPSFSDHFVDEFTAEEATQQYRRWAESWIVHPAKTLIPELKVKKVGT